ncbi:hypothetical protein DC522_23660 [Microvirga sp. KLBC 81]|uniref:hypothetical protein n=1 Tax=Microvirga sp. KLBC 81 TaxID=1862707 RepID=UPI000D52566F|nr:hypothetical protein [Microvirga sp. KLBC 81]PVE22010.1 hypothetical protein DC522_23660 [Microvirga sp. KLBC 81]
MFIPAVVQFTNTVAEQACVDYPLLSDLCADEIEQRIVRAYIQLVFQAVDTDSSRSVVVMRLGSLEVRLAELRLPEANHGLPPFWIEVFDWPHQASIDSIGCYEFGEDELAAAVAMIVSAAHEADTRIGTAAPPLHE